MAATDHHLYRYAATVTGVYDADTITVSITLGFHIQLNDQKVRLYGINAPEVRGKERPEGLVARDYLRDLILDRDVVIRTYRDRSGRYGRWLGVVYLPDGDGWLCVNQRLIDEGHAVVALYGDENKFTGWPVL